MNIIVLGAGIFGTAIANELAVNSKNKVQLYCRRSEQVDEINLYNTNKKYFPNKHLSKNLKATSDSKQISSSDIILIALPSAVLAQTLAALKLYFKKDSLLVNLSKGMLENGTNIVDHLKQLLDHKNIVTLKGPSFAVEVIEHADTLLTLGYSNTDQLNKIVDMINCTGIHIDYTRDIKGVEILSVLKNIYALVLGVVDAKYDSANTRFLVLTKAFSEIRIILKSLGGSEDTLFFACGFGDLCLTSLNDLSRNRTLGLLIGKGFFTADYQSESVILEGLNAIKMIHNLIDKDVLDQLFLFNKVHNFFTLKEKELDFTFNELFN